MKYRETKYTKIMIRDFMKVEGKEGIKDKMIRDKKRIGKFILLYLITFYTNISKVFSSRLCCNAG